MAAMAAWRGAAAAAAVARLMRTRHGDREGGKVAAAAAQAPAQAQAQAWRLVPGGLTRTAVAPLVVMRTIAGPRCEARRLDGHRLTHPPLPMAGQDTGAHLGTAQRLVAAEPRLAQAPLAPVAAAVAAGAQLAGAGGIVPNRLVEAGVEVEEEAVAALRGQLAGLRAHRHRHRLLCRLELTGPWTPSQAAGFAR
jgi:hypothetical protein